MRLFITAAVFLMFSGAVPARGMDSLENIRDLQTSFHAGLTLEHVVDGDTIVADGKKIRLWGIDAPEKKSPYYEVSKMFLEGLLKGGRLTCKFIEKDRYERDVMHCLIDGLDIGSMMVQTGMARDYSKYSGDYYQYEEDLAKAKKLGIWSEKLDKKSPEVSDMCLKHGKGCPY